MVLMPKRRIEVRIRPDGSIVFKPMGYRGVSCKEATRALERAMGEPIDSKLTAEHGLRQVETERQSVKR